MLGLPREISMLELEDEEIPVWSVRFSTGIRAYYGAMFAQFGPIMGVLAIVAAAAFFVYRITGGWTPAFNLAGIALAIDFVVVVAYTGNALSMSMKPESYQEFLWACNWEDPNEDLVDGPANGVLMTSGRSLTGERHIDLSRR
jgi:hypothetical protein